MKKKIKWLRLFVVTFILFCFSTVGLKAEESTETTYYGEKNINGKWYHFDEITGEMTTGWYDFSNKTVYYALTGEMLYGMQVIDGVTYYFDTYDGALIKGEKNIDGKWYHFDEVTGGMTTGWHEFLEKTVYYTSSGSMVHGAYNINGKWYYFSSYDGGMQTGWVQLPEKKCIIMKTALCIMEN